jgi:hypothetical protein
VLSAKQLGVIWSSSHTDGANHDGGWCLQTLHVGVLPRLEGC